MAAVCADERLLVHASNSLHRADVERVLRAKILRMFRLDLTVGLLVLLRLVERLDLCFREHTAFSGDLGLERCQRLLFRLQAVALPNASNSCSGQRETASTNLLVIRTWP